MYTRLYFLIVDINNCVVSNVFMKIQSLSQKAGLVCHKILHDFPIIFRALRRKNYHLQIIILQDDGPKTTQDPGSNGSNTSFCCYSKY